MINSNQTIGKIVNRPTEIPENAVRPGTYLVRFGKGEAYEFEFVEKLNEWFSKGRVYIEYGFNPDWETLPCLKKEQLEAMRIVPEMLSVKWQKVLIGYNRIESSREHRRRVKLLKRKIFN